MSRLLSSAFTAVTVFAIATAVLLIAVPYVFGFERYVITGGSMEGTIHRGAVIFDRVVPVETLKVGDVITFRPPGYESQVTHRIVAVDLADDGQSVFRTKGDANEYADPWQVNLPGPNQARYSFQIPFLGYFLAALTFRSIRLLVLAVPALAIGVSLLVSVWRDAAAERRRELLVALDTLEAER